MKQIITKYTKDYVFQLIQKHSDLVDFGTVESAVSDQVIQETQNKIGFRFSESYLWFLKNFGGGTIGGEEVYSVYVNNPHPASDDIAQQHIINQDEGDISSTALVVMFTDYGELFYFENSKFDGAECPIFTASVGEEPVLYANNFYEFLAKRIESFWVS